jgi:hypothetical protein
VSGDLVKAAVLFGELTKAVGAFEALITAPMLRLLLFVHRPLMLMLLLMLMTPLIRLMQARTS